MGWRRTTRHCPISRDTAVTKTDIPSAGIISDGTDAGRMDLYETLDPDAGEVIDTELVVS